MATVILQDTDKRAALSPIAALRESRSPVAPYESLSSVLPMTRVLSMLPAALALEISKVEAILKEKGERIEEIRLRAERRAYLTVGGRSGRRNLALDALLDGVGLESVLKRICDGSLYSYSESIIKGYVSLGDGVRVGVCGRAATEGGRILGVYAVSSLNIRMPYGVVGVAPRILSAVRESVRHGEGVLVYSPPAEGKTTLLRSLASELSGGESPMRLCLIDSREELNTPCLRREQSTDILTGYPKAEAISIATAFMSPEVIICDEIGGEDDVRAICEAQNCGVPLIASAHAASVEGLLRRPSMLTLHESGVFGLYIGLRISDGAPGYTLVTREEAERRLEDNGNASARAERNVSLLAKA